jgi:hypothetical protein
MRRGELYPPGRARADSRDCLDSSMQTPEVLQQIYKRHSGSRKFLEKESITGRSGLYYKKNRHFRRNQCSEEFSGRSH